jgi:hypothetical protein
VGTKRDISPEPLGAAPCQECMSSGRRAAERLACQSFLMFRQGYGVRSWRPAKFTPSKVFFKKIFKE